MFSIGKATSKFIQFLLQEEFEKYKEKSDKEFEKLKKELGEQVGNSLGRVENIVEQITSSLEGVVNSQADFRRDLDEAVNRVREVNETVASLSTVESINEFMRITKDHEERLSNLEKKLP